MENQLVNRPLSPQIGLSKTEQSVYKGKGGQPISKYSELGISGETDSGLMEGDKYAKSLITAYLTKSLKFIGVKGESFPDAQTGKDLVSYIYKKHDWIRPEEIFLAFEYAVSVDDKQPKKEYRVLDHYQSVSVQMISRVLNMYRSHSEELYDAIVRKNTWYETSHHKWVEARVKDHEAMSESYLQTVIESRDKKSFTYLVLFPKFYDWLDTNGLIPLTIEEKKMISWRVKVSRVDSYSPVMDRIRIDSLFNKDSIADACKRAALLELFNRWDTPPVEFVEKSCYLSEDAFITLSEIMVERKKMEVK